MDYREARAAVEALVFASPQPISAKRIGEILGLDPRSVETILDDLKDRQEREFRGFRIVHVAGGYQMATRPEHAEYVAKLDVPVRQSLSRPALETLAIVAYRQPVTRAEIEKIRGVRADGVLGTLTERGLVRISGRKKAPGRPALYATTSEFLRWFGLASLDELPPIEGDGLALPGLALRYAP